MKKNSKTQHAQSRVSRVCYWLAVQKHLFSKITAAKVARAPCYSSMFWFICCWWFWHLFSLTVNTARQRLYFWGGSLACRTRFCQTSTEVWWRASWAAPSQQEGSPAYNPNAAGPGHLRRITGITKDRSHPQNALHNQGLPNPEAIRYAKTHTRSHNDPLTLWIC